MPSPTLTERHARIGRALDEKEKRLGELGEAIQRMRLAGLDVSFLLVVAQDSSALLEFARKEWERAGREYAEPCGRASEILARLESALAPLLKGGKA